MRETLDLGILQFAKFVLWKDLDEHWDALHDEPPGPPPRRDAHRAVRRRRRGRRRPTWTRWPQQCPVPADASQLDAVARAEAGRTFVLEGPPGTGKSQTITNVLARTLAEGRRVLFVAEKRAALDVVRARLDAIGLGDLCLDLHDKASRPVAVREHLRRALDATFSPDVEGHRRAHDDVTSRARALARYAGALHAPNQDRATRSTPRTTPCSPAETARRCRSRWSSSGPRDRQVLDAVRRSLPDLADLLWRVRPRRHHAWGFVRGAVDRAQMALAVVTVDAALGELARCPTTLRPCSTPPGRRKSCTSSRSSPGRAARRSRLLDEVSSPRWQHASTESRNALIQLRAGAAAGSRGSRTLTS